MHYQPELQNNDDAGGLLGEGTHHGGVAGSGDQDISMGLAGMLVVDYDYSRRVSSASMNSECGGENTLAAGPGGNDMHRGSTASASDLIAGSKISLTHTGTLGSGEFISLPPSPQLRPSHIVQCSK